MIIINNIQFYGTFVVVECRVVAHHQLRIAQQTDHGSARYMAGFCVELFSLSIIAHAIV